MHHRNNHGQKVAFFNPKLFYIHLSNNRFFGQIMLTGQIRKHNSKSPLSNPIPKPVKPRMHSSNSNNCSSSTPPRLRNISLCLLSLEWRSHFLAYRECLFLLNSLSKRFRSHQSCPNRRNRQQVVRDQSRIKNLLLSAPI